ncbi:MAG: hypothetical protein JW829_07850 [Pirellulales bacterium]|nr:hypothetical protein [Pirellulales bacterium]
MFRMDAWDVCLLLAASYLAVMALVRLMAARRRKLVDEVQHQWEAERQRQKHSQKKTA